MKLKASTKRILNHAQGNKVLKKATRKSMANDLRKQRKFFGPLASRKARQHYQNFQ